MKKIGFIDYYISEWHANNYPAWIDSLDRGFKVCYAYAQKDVSEVDGVTTDAWCEKFSIQKCDSIKELYEKSDFVIILSPSNPEKHLEFAHEALKYKKPTYIDKTFAPDYNTAKEIYDLSDKYGTPIFSTSALRYADELLLFKGSKTLSITGGGRSVDEYIVHQLEMAVSTLSTGATGVLLNVNDDRTVIDICYPDDRKATLTHQRKLQFTINDGEKSAVCKSEFFVNLMKKILDFFETGNTDFDRSQTLEIMRLREDILKNLLKKTSI